MYSNVWPADPNYSKTKANILKLSKSIEFRPLKDLLQLLQDQNFYSLGKSKLLQKSTPKTMQIYNIIWDQTYGFLFHINFFIPFLLDYMDPFSEKNLINEPMK